jgi:SAM-dependent methyltransferase
MKLCLACGHRFNAKGWECPSCGYVPKMEAGHYILGAEMATYDDGFDPNYFNELVKIEEENWWFRSRNRLIIWALHRYFPQRNNFLEVGCGTGFILSGIQEAFPDLSLSGGELFMEGLACAAHRLRRVPLFQMDSRRIPFEEEFDVIGAFDMLEHIDEDEEVLVQLFKATKRGGGVILTVPQHRFLWGPLDEYSFHKRRYTRRELVGKVKRAGFEIVYATSFVSFLLPLMMLSRTKQLMSKGNFDPLAEFKMSRVLNSALEKVMDVERVAIRSGISFPTGGSVLLVARRGRR